MILAVELSRSFGRSRPVEAVRGVSFELARGSIGGLVGANGAGKTTVLRVLATLLAPDRGRAEIAGHDVARSPAAARAALGYLPDGVPLPPDATVREYLTFRARAKDVAAVGARVDEVLEVVELGASAERVIGVLSRGTRQRVGLADVLLGAPQVLLLDEPHAGLDPIQLRALRGTLTALAAERTVLVSSHVLAEVEAVATHVLVLHEGRLVREGTRAAVCGDGGLEAAFLAAVGG